MNQMHGRVVEMLGRAVLALMLSALPGAQAASAPADSDLAVQAREAWVKRDRPRLAALVEAARAQRHPLVGWVEYFDHNMRMAELRQTDMDVFYTR